MCLIWDLYLQTMIDHLNLCTYPKSGVQIWVQYTKLSWLPKKGKLISKCLFCTFNSSKKWTKKFNLTTTVPQVELFPFIFLKESTTPKRHFEINWPLVLKPKNETTTFWHVIFRKQCCLENRVSRGLPGLHGVQSILQPKLLLGCSIYKALP